MDTSVEDLMTTAPGSPIAAAFCAQLRRDSYVRLSMPAELVKEAQQHCKRFFALPTHAKIEQAGELSNLEGRHVGFAVEPGLRERVEVRQTVAGDVQPPAFASLQPLLAALGGYACGLLRLIAVDLGHAADFFDATQAMRSKGTSAAQLQHSPMRICHYERRLEERAEDEACVTPCAPHYDVGLLTLNPAGSAPGLEVLRAADQQWAALEEDQPQNASRVYLTVMVGKKLFGYPPALHRVVAPAPGTSRLSLPFLLRGSDEAFLPASLNKASLALLRAESRQARAEEKAKRRHRQDRGWVSTPTVTRTLGLEAK